MKDSWMPSERGRRNIQRLREIIEIAANRGFGFFIARTRLSKFLPQKFRRRPHAEMAPADIAINIRILLEDLGPTFIKLGQLLSVRPDITPPYILAELEKLQDDVPPFSLSDVEKTVIEDLGQPIEELFANFDKKPIASASIGQVHRARLPDGTEVAVKIRRPDIISNIEADLSLLEFAASQIRHIVDFIDPMMVIGEFRKTLEKELDYTNEARNADRFRANFAADPLIKIPMIYWDLTTPRVLTAEYIDGIKVSEIDRAVREGIDYHKLACVGAESFMKQVLVDGFFHGDLHPGNIFITHDSRIAYLDFGIVGELSDEDRETITLLLMAVIKQDSEEIIFRLRELGVVITVETLDTLKIDLREALKKYYGRPIGDLKMAQIAREFLHIVYSNHIKIPRNFALLAKAIVTIEGVAIMLCPDVNVFDLAKPFVEKLVKQYYLHRLTKVDLLEQLRTIVDLVIDGPKLAHKTLDRLATGEITFRVKESADEKAVKEHVRAANRLALSAICSSLLLAAAIVYSRGGHPAVIVSISSVAVVLGIWLLITVRKSGGLS